MCLCVCGVGWGGVGRGRLLNGLLDGQLCLILRHSGAKNIIPLDGSNPIQDCNHYKKCQDFSVEAGERA